MSLVKSIGNLKKNEHLSFKMYFGMELSFTYFFDNNMYEIRIFALNSSAVPIRKKVVNRKPIYFNLTF